MVINLIHSKQNSRRASPTCHFSINAKPYTLRGTLAVLVFPAPTLKYLSLFSRRVSNGRNGRTWNEVFIPDTLFKGAAPGLSYLELRNCDLSWKSPLLKGLESLQILTPSEHARPNLIVWLDALNEMQQLKMLTLDSASPIAPSSQLPVMSSVQSHFLPSHTWMSLPLWVIVHSH
jgi:hypothetical protein